MLLVEIHAVWSVKLFAPFYEDALRLVCLLVDTALNVIHVRQYGESSGGIGELAVVNLVVVEQYGLIWAGETNLSVVYPISDTES